MAYPPGIWHYGDLAAYISAGFRHALNAIATEIPTQKASEYQAKVAADLDLLPIFRQLALFAWKTPKSYPIGNDGGSFCLHHHLCIIV